MKSITKMVTGLCIALLLTSVTASAKTINVTSTAESVTTTGSLRWALAQASQGDIIDCSAIAGGTLVTGGAGYDITTPLVTIEGHGIITDSPFSITAIAVTLRNIVFNGVSNNSGAVVMNNTLTSANGATIENCLFTGCTLGGAIFAYWETTVRNCIFANNTSQFGGAINIYAAGSQNQVHVYGCTFYNNSANNDGGAIYIGDKCFAYLGGNLFYGNNVTGTGFGSVIYAMPLGGVSSRGYNVTDKTLYLNNTDNFGYRFHEELGDRQIAYLTFNTTTFRPLGPILNSVPSVMANFPSTDYYGATRSFPSASGAVEYNASYVTRPTVSSVTPAGANQAASGNIVITFDKAMDTQTAGTVQLNSMTALDATAGSWSSGNTVYTVPYSGLSGGTNYTVNISGFSDQVGNVMNAVTSGYTFTVENTPPTVVSVLPSGGSEPTNGAVVIEFDEPMDTQTAGRYG